MTLFAISSKPFDLVLTDGFYALWHGYDVDLLDTIGFGNDANETRVGELKILGFWKPC